ncbi:fimbrial protein [Serratia silvae]|uniref:Fimbrial protein n=1 Tax=Serratia silvae TaxID=2824122 RepID=A0ABT0K6V7_9GAMM|nr:fimbrial protein [Serratia silvae]MCL1027764.1 fimbrial protein [Serratia silvae]
MPWKISTGLAGLVLVLGMSAAIAATSNLTISGNILLPPPCVINGDQLITVDFTNEVMTTRVDGINYRQPVPYTLECSAGNTNALKMRIVGVDAGFAGALYTSKGDLGIALTNDSQAMPVNSWLNFTLPNQPKLFATLVKRPGTTLSGGPFTAGATMVIDYQ